MMTVKLLFGSQKVTVVGNILTIRQKASKRAGCRPEQIVFKIRDEDGDMCEIANTRVAWEALSSKAKTIHVSVKGADDNGTKRKAGNEKDRRGRSDVSRTPPRDTHKRNRRDDPSREGSTAGLSVARRRDITPASTINPSQRRIERSSRRTDTAASPSWKRTASGIEKVSSKKRWTPKEDEILWRKINSIVDGMRAPNPIYSFEESERVFKTIQQSDVFKDRSVGAIKGRMQTRTSHAQKSGLPFPTRIKALFPLTAYRATNGDVRTNTTEISSDEQSDWDEDSSEEDSSEEDSSVDEPLSQSGSPPQSKVGPEEQSRPASIRSYNPFASISAIAPREASTQRPLARKTGPPLPITAEGQSRLPAISMAPNTPRPSTTSMAPKAPRSSTSSMPSNTPRPSASNTAPHTPRPAIKVDGGEQEGRGPASAVPSPLATPTVAGSVAAEAIIIKDESGDELDDSSERGACDESLPFKSYADVPLSFSVEAIRLSVRRHSAALYPLERIDVLPSTDWAVDLAQWMRENVMAGLMETRDRVETLIVCFDEFFHHSFVHVNSAYSIRRASFAIMLLFLDLYHALSNVEEVQIALTEIFYRRTFSPSASQPKRTHDWPASDFCSAATLIIPTRPAWLIGLVLKRAGCLTTAHVFPPTGRVQTLFKQVKELLDRLEQSRKFINTNGRLNLLLNSIHLPLFDNETVANLRSLFRQSRVSPTETEGYSATLLAISDYNQVAAREDLKRKAAEEAFFNERLILLSSSKPLDLKMVESIIVEYSLPLQTANGPVKNTFPSPAKTLYLWVLQMPDGVSKRAARGVVQAHPPGRSVHFLFNWQEAHKGGPEQHSTVEERQWSRSCCDMQFHRENHCHAVSHLRGKQRA